MATITPGPNRPWSETTSDALGIAAQTTTKWAEVPDKASATGIKFWGTCPLCTHEFEYVWPLEVLRVAKENPLVMCSCTYPHAGRPKDTPRGCGAYWVSLVAS
jgi:hypothetical protein